MTIQASQFREKREDYVCVWMCSRSKSSVVEFLSCRHGGGVWASRTEEQQEYLRKWCYFSPVCECVHRILVFHRLKLSNKHLTDPLCTKISSSKGDLMWMDVVDSIVLRYPRNMMNCVLVFYGSDSEATRKLICENLAIRNLGERWWVVKIHKGICDALIERERSGVRIRLYFTHFL